MMERNVDLTDGKQIAEVLLSYYLNSYDRIHPDFMEQMYQEKPEIRNNFMALIVQWFLNLASRKPYEWDDRNAKSVELAMEVKTQLSQANIMVRVSKKKNPESHMMVSCRDSQSVEQMMAVYLSRTEGEEPFKVLISELKDKHRTLQQNFTRFVREWCEWLIKENPAGRSREIQTAKIIVQPRIPLPYI